MARKTAAKPQQLTAESLESPQIGAPPGADAEMPEVLSWIRSNLPQGGEADLNIRVYKIEGTAGRGGGSRPYLFDATADELPFLEQQLAGDFPQGGKFQVVVRLNGKVATSAMMDIAPRPNYRAPARFAALQPEPVVSLPPRSETENAIAQLIKFNMEQAARQNDFNQQLLLALRERPAAAAAVDPQAIIANTMGMFKSFQEAMPKASSENVMDVLTKGIEFGKMIAGNNDAPAAKGLAGMVEALVTSDLGKSLATVVAQGATNRPAQPPMLTHQPAHQGGARVIPQYRPATAAAPQEQSAPQGAGGVTMNQAMQFLFGQASQGADPALIADQVGPMIPEHVWEALENSDDAVSYLASMYPKVNTFRAWFDRLAENLLEDAPGGDDLAEKTDAIVEQHSAS